jgi:hypothetical protein
MFVAAAIAGIIARRFGPHPIGDSVADPGLLVLSYWFATKFSFIVGVPAFAAAAFGLLRTKLWGRRLFTVLMIAWLAQTIFFGIFNLSMTSGLAGLFENLAMLTAGSVLAMSYLTPLAADFTTEVRADAQPSTGMAPA